MFDKRVINGTAIAVVFVFLFLSGVDVVSVDYEVPIAWYSLIAGLFTAMGAASVGVTLSKRKDHLDEPEAPQPTPKRKPHKKVPSESDLIHKLKKVPIEELFPEQEREED